jgi:uncharacterized protein
LVSSFCMRSRLLQNRVSLCILLALFWVSFRPLAAAVDIDKLPKPTGYVSDLAHVVDPVDKEALEVFCTKVEQQLGVQFALVTIDSVGDTPIRDFALELSRKWGVGAKKDNQGVLLLLSIKDRKSDIETGRGVEPYITDGFAGSTLRSMRPALREGNYGAGLLAAAHEMASQIAQGKGVAFTEAAPEQRPQVDENRGSHGIPFPLLVIGILFLLFVLSRGNRGGRGGRGGGGSFLTGMLLGNLLGGGGRSGGGWGSGGGFGGGSGGGGGFGGFGGGDFGGGGANSDW